MNKQCALHCCQGNALYLPFT